MHEPHHPAASYRLQLHQGLGFAGARALIEYLYELGITDCYTSPLLAAAPGSTHGYDVVDHARTDPALGTEAELERFATALRDRGMGLIVDVVPNHMCITSPANGWWNDVLENGPSSPFAGHFDIDWDPPKADLKAKVLLPVLGDQFGRVLERCEIAVRYEDDSFVAAYHDTVLPIAPRTWPHLLEPMLAELRTRLGGEDERVLELESILTSLEHLPLRTDTDRRRVRERRREKEIARRRLAALVAASPEARAALDHSVTLVNGTPGDPASVDRLEALLADQGYRPSFWRVAADEINYRRFFDINQLAAIRIEEPEVLRAVHAVVLRLARRGLVTGLRIDHVDGLLSPRRYLDELQRALHLPAAEDGTAPADCYIVVEKILGPEESLPPGWPVDGTTGYEMAALFTGVAVSPSGLDAVVDVYRGFTGSRLALPDVIYESKQLVLRSAMSAELTVLARRLDDISEQHRTSRDFTLASLQDALAEMIACFPVYRTYVDVDDAAVGEVDRRHIELARDEAKRRNPATSASIYDFVAGLLLLDDPGGLDDVQRAARRDFVLRFQQLTSPVTAKGVEDTAFYRYLPLAALNEVGGGYPGVVSIEEFHQACMRRAAETPRAMTTTSTHDSKRSEDVRARLCVLSELPGVWQIALARLSQQARPHKPRPGVPDPEEEYLLYQTLVGVWPPGKAAPDAAFVARIQEYVNKALREAKVHTSWINPNEHRDDEVRRFIASLLDPDGGAGFLTELGALCRELERPGYFNSLSQLVLKIGVPGVPDLYQGSELWDDSLVDPDNRRPVDFELRRRLLGEVRRDGERDAAGYVDRLRATIEDGRLKMFVTMRGLHLRRAQRDVFTRGRHQPLATHGVHADRVIAFAREHDGRRVLVVCGRHFTAIAGPRLDPIGLRWADTTVDGGGRGRRYRDALTDRVVTCDDDGRLALRDVFAGLPVAMLEALP